MCVCNPQQCSAAQVHLYNIKLCFCPEAQKSPAEYRSLINRINVKLLCDLCGRSARLLAFRGRVWHKIQQSLLPSSAAAMILCDGFWVSGLVCAQFVIRGFCNVQFIPQWGSLQESSNINKLENYKCKVERTDGSKNTELNTHAESKSHTEFWFQKTSSDYFFISCLYSSLNL